MNTLIIHSCMFERKGCRDTLSVFHYFPKCSRKPLDTYFSCVISQSGRLVEVGRDLWRAPDLLQAPCSSGATRSWLPRTVSRWL